jgi:hypothetical protein
MSPFETQSPEPRSQFADDYFAAFDIAYLDAVHRSHTFTRDDLLSCHDGAVGRAVQNRRNRGQEDADTDALASACFAEAAIRLGFNADGLPRFPQFARDQACLSEARREYAEAYHPAFDDWFTTPAAPSRDALRILRGAEAMGDCAGRAAVRSLPFYISVTEMHGFATESYADACRRNGVSQ